MSLTAAGFERPRLAEIKADIDQDFADALGPVNTNADAVLGQISGIVSEAVDNLYEALQNTYDSQYPFSAEGTALDGAVAFVGLTRLAATSTIVTAVVYGAEGTLIPAASLATVGVQYASTSDVVISRANAVDLSLEVNTVASSSIYNVVAGGLVANFTTDASATKAEILAGLAALLNVDPLYAVVTGETLRIYARDGESPFTVTADSRLTITKIGSPVVFEAVSAGANAVPVGAMTALDSPIDGVTSLYNLNVGSIGRDVETDVELRLRHASSVRATGSATVEAIKARMLADLPTVTSIKIYENRTMVTSADGIPAHAFESVIVGGVNQEIAEQLWLTKPAGIETYGNVSVTVTDTQGDAQIVRFSRTVPKYAWLNVQVNSLNGEETLPASAIANIKAAVVNFANANLGAGDDIILQKFFGPIYTAVDGLGQITLTAAVTATEAGPPTYAGTNISIGKSENAIFDTSRVTVTGI